MKIINIILILGIIISLVGSISYGITGYGTRELTGSVKLIVSSNYVDWDIYGEDTFLGDASANSVIGEMCGVSFLDPKDTTGSLLISTVTRIAANNFNLSNVNGSMPVIIQNRGSYPMSLYISMENVNLDANLTSMSLAFAPANYNITNVSGWKKTLDYQDTFQGSKTFQTEYFSITNNLPQGIPIQRTDHAIPGYRNASLTTWTKVTDIGAVYNIDPYLTSPFSNEVYMFPFIILETPLAMNGYNTSYSLRFTPYNSNPVARTDISFLPNRPTGVVGWNYSNFYPYVSYNTSTSSSVLMKIYEKASGTSGNRSIEMLSYPGYDFTNVQVLSINGSVLSGPSINFSSYHVLIENIPVVAGNPNKGAIINITGITRWCEQNPGNNKAWIPGGFATAVFNSLDIKPRIDHDDNFLGSPWDCHSGQGLVGGVPTWNPY